MLRDLAKGGTAFGLELGERRMCGHERVRESAALLSALDPRPPRTVTVMGVVTAPRFGAGGFRVARITAASACSAAICCSMLLIVAFFAAVSLAGVFAAVTRGFLDVLGEDSSESSSSSSDG